MIKVICVCGARPNFIKIAPLMKAFKENGQFKAFLVHTGQHYDENMSRLFFDELGIPKPDINLEVGSGSHTQQTAEIMRRFEPVVLEHKPDFVLVVGDVNSTIACGLVAVKLGVKLIHVEAGLRSFDRAMPEEINRILTDTISDLLFVTEQSGIDNLRKEGFNSDKVHFVGNVMIDTLLANREKAERSDILEKLNLEKKKYAVITLHRPSNVDDIANFEKIISAFEIIQKDIKLVFPIHPRTRRNLEGSKLGDKVKLLNNLILLEPAGYLDFLKLTANAALVMTDSGGIQEETTILQIPCMTLRENTERPVTITEGTNCLVHIDTADILKHYNEIKANNFGAKGKIPKFWDGRAAKRIVCIIISKHMKLFENPAKTGMTETKITNREIYSNVLSDGTIYGKLDIRDLKRFADTAKYLVPDAESILDVGCFCGEWLNYAVAHKKTIQRHLGIEVAQNKVDEAHKQYPHLNIKCEFAEKLNLPPQNFDVVTCLEVLEHIPDWHSVFNSLFKFASRQVLITVPYKELIMQTACIHCGKITPMYGHLRRYSETDFPEVSGWNRSFAKLIDKSSRPLFKKLYRFLRPHYSWLLVNYRRTRK